MNREYFFKRIEELFSVTPIVALLGPRQCGKTTLAKQYFENNGGKYKSNYFDLEDPLEQTLLENPSLILIELCGCVADIPVHF